MASTGDAVAVQRPLAGVKASHNRSDLIRRRSPFDTPPTARGTLSTSCVMQTAHDLDQFRADSGRSRRADRALPEGRSAGLGADRPPVLAAGVQRRLQVRRPARRGGRPDAGRLPEGLQVARDLRPARELPDLARQRQPQPLHRPLPQRAQGAGDDRPRRERRRPLAGLGRGRRRTWRSSAATWPRSCAARCSSCPRRFGQRW